MSIKSSERPLRLFITWHMSSCVIMARGAVVELITTSASTNASGSSGKVRWRAPKRCARSIACDCVLFMITSRCAPLSQRLRAANSLICPDPTRRTHASLSLGNTCRANCTATWLIEVALRLMPVSLRARLPVARAARKSADVIGPA